MRNLSHLLVLVVGLIIAPSLVASAAGVFRTGSITLKISGNFQHTADQNGTINCTETVTSADANNNFATANEKGTINGSNFSCNVTVFYNWYLQDAGSIATLSFSLTYVNSSGSEILYISENVATSPLPPDLNLVVPVATTL